MSTVPCGINHSVYRFYSTSIVENASLTKAVKYNEYPELSYTTQAGIFTIDTFLLFIFLFFSVAQQLK
jgi:hypothetical protein